MSRYRDPQPQVAEHYSYFYSLITNIHKTWKGKGLIKKVIVCRVGFRILKGGMSYEKLVGLPANTKRLYSIYTMLGRRCINVIQTFCVCWASAKEYKSIHVISLDGSRPNCWSCNGSFNLFFSISSDF